VLNVDVFGHAAFLDCNPGAEYAMDRGSRIDAWARRHTPPVPEDGAGCRRIVTALGETDFCLPGNASDERICSGKPSLRRKGDPAVPHGLGPHQTRKIDGKIPGCYLIRAQLERNTGWFGNAHPTRQLLTKFETLSPRIAGRTEGWEPQAPATARRSRPDARASASASSTEASASSTEHQ